MMRHEANPMKQNIPKSDEVWYVDSVVSNHMTSHKEWFSYLEKPTQPGVVATGDDTPHPIANVGEVPLSHVGQKGKLLNVLARTSPNTSRSMNTRWPIEGQSGYKWCRRSTGSTHLMSKQG